MFENKVKALLKELAEAKEEAGRSERGRQLAVANTDLEKVWAYCRAFSL